jgi:alpha-1,6-mannosyltransferase
MGKVLKIIDITEFYSERGGGIRSHLEGRGQFFCRLGHDHLVIAPGPRNEEITSDASIAPIGTAKVVRLEGRTLPYDRTYHLLAQFDKIRLRVRTERPDVLEAHSPYLGAAAVLACGRGAARVRTSFWHADHFRTYVIPAMRATFGARVVAERMEPWTQPVWSAIARTLLAPFDATFVAGAEQAQSLRRAGVRDVVHVPFGVDTRTFHPGQRNDALRRELLDGAAGPVLVAVGRLAIEKRWDVVLAAHESVRARHPGAVLVVFGDGPERSRLERASAPGVRFAGFERDRRRLAEALASADLLVHACPYETFGLGVAEAVACGIPVVVPDAGGALSSADPEARAVYASLNARACAAAIEKVLTDRGYAARTRALAAAARVQTAEDHVRAVLSTYEDLLRRKQRRTGGEG